MATPPSIPIYIQVQGHPSYTQHKRTSYNSTRVHTVCRIHTVYNWLNNARLDMIFFTAGTRPGLKR
jgi:hypothetical protein